MTSSYQNLDVWAAWASLKWSMESQNLSNNEAYDIEYDDLLTDYSQHQPELPPGNSQQYYLDPSNVPNQAIDCVGQPSQAWEQPSTGSMASPPVCCSHGMSLPRSFGNLPPRLDPPDTHGLQTQSPRFEGDLYTAPFIKGEGVERAGWCGFCSSWHKLKDSAYWYVNKKLQHAANFAGSLPSALTGTTCTTPMASVVQPVGE